MQVVVILVVISSISSLSHSYSSLQVMWSSIFCESVMSISLSSGERIASSIASMARFSPLAMPAPIIAVPLFDITLFTSRKSTFI